MIITKNTIYPLNGFSLSGFGGSGAAGPASSTNNAVPRFSGTAGNALLNSGVLIDGSNNISGVANFANSGTLVAGTGNNTFNWDGTNVSVPYSTTGSNITTERYGKSTVIGNDQVAGSTLDVFLGSSGSGTGTATFTNGQPTVTGATGYSFTNADVGKTITASTYTGVILSVQSTSSFTLTTNSTVNGSQSFTVYTILNNVYSTLVGHGATALCSGSTVVGFGAQASNNSQYGNNGFGGAPYGGYPTIIGAFGGMQENGTSGQGNGTSVGSFAQTGTNESVSIGPSCKAMQLACFALGDKAESMADSGTATAHGGEITIGDAIRSSGYQNINIGFGGHSTHDTTILFCFTSNIGNSSGNSSTFANNQMLIGGVNLVDATKSGIRDVWIGNGDVITNSAWTNATPFDLTINATGGAGSNIAGANITIRPGASTGSGAGGSFRVATTAASGSSSTANSFTTNFQIDSAGHVDALNGSVYRVIGNAIAGNWVKVHGNTASAFLNLATVEITANAGAGVIGYNIGETSGGSFARDNTSASAVGLTFNAQAGSPDRFTLNYITSAGTSSNPFNYELTTSAFGLISGAQFGWNASSTDTTANSAALDTILRRQAAANVAFGAADAASAVAQSLSVQNVVAGTSNTAGASWTHIASLSTGNAIPGRMHFQGGAISATSGTTQQTAVDREIFSISKVLTNNSAISIFNMPTASNTVVASAISYAIEVFDGTNLQVEQGQVSFTNINKGGAFSGNTIVKYGNQQAVTSGTLTVTFAVSAANPAVVTCNANSSLTPSTGYPRITYSLQNCTQQAINIL